MNRKHFYAAVIILSFLIVGIQPARAIDIPDNTTVGDWDDINRIYTLTSDVTEGLVVTESNLTLDGNGNTINLDSSGGTGVSLPGVPPDEGPAVGYTYVTIKNLNIINCDTGIYLKYVNHIDIINNNVSNCQYGIYMFRAGTCIPAGEREGITGNNIVSNWYGILIQRCDTIGIYNNNFIDNDDQAILAAPNPLYPNINIIFNLALPTGGNYWSNWCPPDHPDVVPEGGDGIVDDPYEVGPIKDEIATDYYPLAAPLPLTPEQAILNLIDTVEDMNLQQGIDNSLDAKLDSALNALDDVNQNNDVAAINSLNAFINAVEAQRGNKLTDNQADILVADANAIITLLGG